MTALHPTDASILPLTAAQFEMVLESSAALQGATAVASAAGQALQAARQQHALTVLTLKVALGIPAETVVQIDPVARALVWTGRHPGDHCSPEFFERCVAEQHDITNGQVLRNGAP